MHVNNPSAQSHLLLTNDSFFPRAPSATFINKI